jgi:hypothetical protein
MHGLYLVWWVQDKGMSPALVAAILAAGDLVLFAVELPTGWFADRVGYRASLLLGSAVQTVGMLWCWLGEGVPGLVTASVLVALGDGFRSGADQALLYRTCQALGREPDFQRIEARTEAIALGALVVLVLLGGALVHGGGFWLGWFAEAVLCAVGFIIALGMREPPLSASSDGDAAANTTAAEAPTPSNQPSIGVPYRRVAAAIVPAALVHGAASATSFLSQTSGENGVLYVTVLVAMLTAAEAIGCAWASRLPGVTASLQRRLLSCASVLVVIVLAAPALMPMAALLLAVLTGLAEPLRAAAIQRLASEQIRARAASAASACDMAVSIIALPVAGSWQSRRR